MNLTGKIITGVAVAAGLALGGRALWKERTLSQLERSLAQPTGDGKPFDEAMLADLPPSAQRYLRHTIAPGTPLATSVRLRMSGRMRPSPGADFVDLKAEETLAPPRGFVWRARLRMKGLPVRVDDYYAAGRGEVAVSLLRAIPIQTNRSSDVTRSARGRLAGESVWVPAALLPSAGAVWEEIDENRARATITIDGEPIALTLRVDEGGRLQEVTMRRYGNVGVPDWQEIPYGFAVEREETFGGYTIPTKLRGGWWYGTERYVAEEASSFTVHDARY